MECPECNKPFKVTEYNLAMPGTKEKEPINCPYCGHEVTEMVSNGWWNTHKMSDVEIEEYYRNKSK